MACQPILGYLIEKKVFSRKQLYCFKQLIIIVIIIIIIIIMIIIIIIHSRIYIYIYIDYEKYRIQWWVIANYIS